MKTRRAPADCYISPCLNIKQIYLSELPRDLENTHSDREEKGTGVNWGHTTQHDSLAKTMLQGTKEADEETDKGGAGQKTPRPGPALTGRSSRLRPLTDPNGGSCLHRRPMRPPYGLTATGLMHDTCMPRFHSLGLTIVFMGSDGGGVGTGQSWSGLFSLSIHAGLMVSG